MSHSKSQSVLPRFLPGARVRVKPGVADPDFPDIPLAGWSGTVQQVERWADEVAYEIGWHPATLRNMKPVFRKRCERDGLALETMWLVDDDLEPDDGDEAAVGRPSLGVARPLSDSDRDDRIRMVFGLTHDDPLPEVGRESLLAYHAYLSERLTFPIQARYEKRIGESKRVETPLSVTALLRTDECEIGEETGLVGRGRDPEERLDFLLAEIEARGSGPAARLIGDYVYWFRGRSGDRSPRG